jgi:hypothetical protein
MKKGITKKGLTLFVNETPAQTKAIVRISEDMLRISLLDRRQAARELDAWIRRYEMELIADGTTEGDDFKEGA